jgi:hypothetical protein
MASMHMMSGGLGDRDDDFIRPSRREARDSCDDYEGAHVAVGVTTSTKTRGTAIVGVVEVMVAMSRVRSARMVVAWRPCSVEMVVATAAGRFSFFSS